MSHSEKNINNNTIQSLENKVNNYKKQISILEEKLKVYEQDSNTKQEKINEQMNHIVQLETENTKLKNIMNNNKIVHTMSDKNYFSTTSSQNNINNNNVNEELKSMQIIINNLKKENTNLIKELNNQKEENSKISRNLKIKSEESEKLTQNLKEKINENEMYSQDNIILLNKLKEYEENFLTMRNNSNNNMNNKCTNQISENNYYDKQNNKIKEEEIIEKFNNQITELNKLIMSELKTISQYIDTYLILFNEENLLIPNLKKITNFPNNAFLNFDILINSIQNARERLFEQQNKNENIILSLKDEISLLNNKLNEKIIENSQIKNQLNNLKEKNYELELYLEKYSGEIDNQKNLTKKIQNSISNIDENNDKYLQNIYDILRDELEKILRDNELRNYASIILSSEKKSQSVDFGIKFLFEEALDKFIFINNCLIDDYKKLQSKKIQDPSIYINTINELNETISELKERLAKKENNSFFRNSSLRKYSDGKFE